MSTDLPELIPSVDWSTLPESLLLMIFSKCEATDLLAIKDVCVQWHRIGCDFTLTSRLHLPKPIDKNLLKNLLLFMANRLTSVKLKKDVIIYNVQRVPRRNHCRKKSVDDQILKILRDDCIHLRRLALEEMNRTITYVILPSNLSHLSLYGSETDCFYAINDIDFCYAKFQSIVFLDISRLQSFESICCHRLNQFKRLRYLYLEGLCRINDDGLRDITTQLISQLVVLDLESTEVTDDSVEYILSNGQSLEELYLGRTKTAGDFNLSQSVAKRLKVLCVLKTNVDYNNLRQIIKAHPCLKSVYCDQNIRQTLNSVILSTDEDCHHSSSKQRFEENYLI